MSVTIRKATIADAEAACAVLRRSIIELCVADHHNDPAILAHWLSNKRPENIASWIALPDSTMLLAVEGKDVLGVGSVTDAGEITLNYVSPDARFRGVSRQLMQALEARAKQSGNIRCHLTSTMTARRFYLSRGYREDKPIPGKFGCGESYLMSKTLA